MGISFRHYLFAEDGSLRRLPQRIVDELPTGRDAIPEFAATRQRVAYVVLESAEGRPRRILDARGERARDAAPNRQAWCGAAFRLYGPDGKLIRGLLRRLP